MSVLLDENIDRFLKSQFASDMDVFTVSEQGWTSMENGKLLRVAQHEFDVLITMDKNLEHQQNLNMINIGIVVIRAQSNSYQSVAPLMPQVNEAIKIVTAGEVVHVTT